MLHFILPVLKKHASCSMGGSDALPFSWVFYHAVSIFQFFFNSPSMSFLPTPKIEKENRLTLFHPPPSTLHPPPSTHLAPSSPVLSSSTIRPKVTLAPTPRASNGSAWATPPSTRAASGCSPRRRPTRRPKGRRRRRKRRSSVAKGVYFWRPGLRLGLGVPCFV